MGYQVKYTLKDYAPLAYLFGVSFVVSIVHQHALKESGLDSFMVCLMGMIFLLFSVFKLINIDGFAEGLRKYDPLAQKVRMYAMVVPFLELVFALAFLGHFDMPLLYGAVFAYAAYNAVTIRMALKNGLDTRCACLGTALNVPLSTVSFLENVFMGVMSILMAVYHYLI